MIKPNWDMFKTKFSESPQENFEWFCYLLFCKEHNKPFGIHRFKNQASIETDLIEHQDANIGWQAKFYDVALSERKAQLLSTVISAKTNYPIITKLIIYTNQEWGQNKGSKPAGKVEIDNKAIELNIELIWRTASYFESPFVTNECEIYSKHFFTSEKSIFNTITELQFHTKNILETIQDKIVFNEQEIKIEKSEIIIKLLNSQNNISLISGSGGVGKTALIKDLYNSLDTHLFLVFKATEFEIRHINDLLKDYSIYEFIQATNDTENKVIVIDSAEKLLDLQNKEPFKEFIKILIDSNWKIVFTTRAYYAEELYGDLSNIYNCIPLNITMNLLEERELERLSEDFSFDLPEDFKLKELIKNPFYLNKYLKNYNDTNKLNYIDFKNKLWKDDIFKSKPQREVCFLEVVKQKIVTSYFYVQISGHEVSLEELRQDEILGYETSGYFITHDIYEEWAIEKIIETSYNKRVSEIDFFERIGESLPIRRSFRNWTSEKLMLEDKSIKTFIENILYSNEIQKIWKDEIYTSILLSDYSEYFFQMFKDELLANDQTLLKHLTFILRIACKEVDDEIFKKISLEDSSDFFSLRYNFSKPRGKGWESIIKFIYDNIEIIKLNQMQYILSILNDWLTKSKTGETARYASLIVLRYYELINQKDYTYSYKDSIQTICKVLSLGSNEIKKELEDIFNKILKMENIRKNDYSDFIKLILTDLNGLEFCINLPDITLRLANKIWTKEKANKEDGWTHFQRDNVEDAFNITSDYKYGYLTVSAYQTPIYFLFKYHFKETLDFLIDFINEKVEYYAKSDCKFKENIIEVEISIDGDIIKQYHSKSLWGMYRGIISPVKPYLLQSLHMALEKFLLEMISSYNNIELIKTTLNYILLKSKSSSITAVLASVVLANPYKCFDFAKILFKTKEFFEADFIRYFQDYSGAKSLYGMGYGINYKDNFYQDERLKTCEEKHRKSHLENLFLQYQYFRTEEISVEMSKKLQEDLWNILDNYYNKLPNEDMQTEDEKKWAITLARMDKRTMSIETKKVDGGIEIAYNAKLTPKLESYSNSVQEKSLESIKYTELYLWSLNKLENDKNYEKYQKYETDPLLALSDIKEVLNIPQKERDFIFQDEIFLNVSIVMIREYSNLLQDDDKELCKSIILEFATLPFQDSYHCQVSDGVKQAIYHLPLLIDFFPNMKCEIRFFLLLHLFNDSKIGMNDKLFNDFAINSVAKYFESDIVSFVWAYVTLKPKYNEEIELLQKQREINIARQIENFKSSNEKNIKIFCKNEITDFYNISIDNLKLEELVTVFKFVSKNQTSIDKEFVQNIIHKCSISIFFDKNEQNSKSSSQRQFIKQLAKFLLCCDNQKDIEFYLEPILNQFKLTKIEMSEKTRTFKYLKEHKGINATRNEFIATKEIVDLFLELIFAQDKLNKYDNFWYIWGLFKSKIIKISEANYNPTLVEDTIKVYLLSFCKYGEIWRNQSKEWHSFKDKNKMFMKEMSKTLKHHKSALYAISYFLNSIGSRFLDDGLEWLHEMLNSNEIYDGKTFDNNIVYYLELFIKKYVYENMEEIKIECSTKEKVICVLNLLVNNSSTTGYLLRERIA